MKDVLINPQVYDDLTEIESFIAKEDSSKSKEVIRKIIDNFELLGKFPEMGAHLNNKIHIDAKYRYIISYPFAIIYYNDDKYLYIVSVIHLSRDFSALDFEEKNK